MKCRNCQKALHTLPLSYNGDLFCSASCAAAFEKAKQNVEMIKAQADLLREGLAKSRELEEERWAREQGGPSALETQVSGDHYKYMPIQPVEFCQKNQLGYCESAAIKYICRHRKKNGADDLRKAIHYLEILIQMEYGDAE